LKQAEANKLINQLIKANGKKHHWKSSSGFLFIKKENLFFVLIILINAKERRLSYSLYYKLYDFDEVFWHLVDLKENVKMPLSFHANGAWTAPTMEINKGSNNFNEWNTNIIEDNIEQIVIKADGISNQLAEKINSIESNLEFLEKMMSKTLEKFPNTNLNLYREQIMSAILKKNYQQALLICEERIAQKDSGGFMVGNESFYEKSKKYIDQLIL